MAGRPSLMGMDHDNLLAGQLVNIKEQRLSPLTILPFEAFMFICDVLSEMVNIDVMVHTVTLLCLFGGSHLPNICHC